MTAVACFAVAIPLTSASTHVSQGQVTIWPGSSARFANMDWNCNYSPALHTKDSNGGPINTDAQVNCSRENTPRDSAPTWPAIGSPWNGAAAGAAANSGGASLF